MTTKKSELLDAYLRLDTAAISDALDALGLPAGQGGFSPLWGTPRVTGFAVTVQLEPFKPGPAGAHIGTTAVAEAGDTDLIVVNNSGRTDVSCWGGLLSLGAQLKGVRGVVADGVCRDINEARDIGFPIFAKGSTPATARGRLRQRSTGEPVSLGQVSVMAGDLVFADETGVVVVPAGHVVEVLAKAQAVSQREAGIAADLRAGAPLHEAMHDARLAGTSN